MRINKLLPDYIPLIDPVIPKVSPLQPIPHASLLSSTPEEIQKNLQAWREFRERIHIVV